jgi:hypothetical protein
VAHHAASALAAAAVVAHAAAAAPADQVQEQPAPMAAQQPEAPPVVESPRGPGFGDSLKRGQRLDLMDEAELRAYARTIGISPRDCEGLTVERLRQNCTAHLYELIDAL